MMLPHVHIPRTAAVAIKRWQQNVEASNQLFHLFDTLALKDDDIADAINVTRQTVVLWRRGLKRPTDKNIAELNQLCAMIAKHLTSEHPVVHALKNELLWINEVGHFPPYRKIKTDRVDAGNLGDDQGDA